MNIKNSDSIKSNITDISAVHNFNESKEDVIKQERSVTNRTFSKSLGNLSNLPPLKRILLSNNRRLTFLSNYSQIYHTFDEMRTRSQRFKEIYEILNTN